MDKPGEFRQRGHLEDADATDVALGPGSAEAGVDAWLARGALCRTCFRGATTLTV
jgi:hypothetical protein